MPRTDGVTIQLTPGQLKSKTAYTIDPLMAEMVEVVQPDWRSRTNDEVECADFWKEQPVMGFLRRGER